MSGVIAWGKVLVLIFPSMRRFIMAGFRYLKSISEFFSGHFVIALASGLAGGAIALGYGTMNGDPDAAYNALLSALVCAAMAYLLKAMIKH